jgi:hypothetical protein
MTRYADFTRLKLYGVVTVLLTVLIVPVTASFVFQNVAVNPSPPLEAGQQVSGNSQLVIIPQGGSTTFITNNQLELTTQLDTARWDVGVLVNGIPAAQIPMEGNIVYINGYLLSYPVSDDVAVSIKVNGTVPQAAGQSLTIVQADQLNNAGQVVPGSTQAISEPLTTQVSTTIPVLSLTSSPVQQATTIPTKIPGFSMPEVAAGLIIGTLVLIHFRGNRKN